MQPYLDEHDDEEEGLILEEHHYHAPSVLDNLQESRRKLPVYKHKTEFLYLLERHQVLIVVGQTGSGKTTQLPQYAWEAGWSDTRLSIVCTQPRRLAAINVARHVADEVGCTLGSTVGYSVRFDDCTAEDSTRIKYVTDGVLFREALMDPLLSHYSVIMLDEVHERTTHTDLLLALLKRILHHRNALKKGPPLRVILSSATVEAEGLKRWFGGDAAILSVQGRLHPVRINYLMEPCMNLVEEAARTVIALHEKHPINDRGEDGPGDILVFLAGKEDIDRCHELISSDAPSSLLSSLLLVKLHASLSLSEQEMVFKKTPKGLRKVILSTNVAEASITVDGIVFVIDGGVAKQKIFNPKTGHDLLLTCPISQASAQQRAGRAGRIRPGHVYRLYTEYHYNHGLPAHSIPEIQKCDLSHVILQLKALGVDRVASFDLPSPPDPEMMVAAVEQLALLGALDPRTGSLTDPIGKLMSLLPLEPTQSRMLLSAIHHGCLQEMLAIVSMLSCLPIFINHPSTSTNQCALDEAIRGVSFEEGDLISYLNIFRYFESNAQPVAWCKKHMLNQKALTRAIYLRNLLTKYLQHHHFPNTVSSSSSSSSKSSKSLEPIIRCICDGLFMNVAILQPDGSYAPVDGVESAGIGGNRRMHVHPTSVLFHRAPPLLLYHRIIETQSGEKVFIADCTVITRELLLQAHPEYYRLR